MSEAAGNVPLRLVLGQLGPDFDSTRAYPFAPWCLVDAAEGLADPADYDFPRVFADRAALEKSWADGCRLAEHLAQVWGERLNARHGCKHGADFWRVYLVDWLCVVIQTVWYRWRYAELWLARHGDRIWQLEDWDREVSWDFPTFSALYHALVTPSLDRWLTARVVDRLAPAHWPRVQVAVNDSRKDRAVALPSAAQTVGGRIAARLFGRLPFDAIPGIGAAKLLFSVAILAMPRSPARNHFRRGDTAATGMFPAAFLDLLDEILQALTPRSFAADFSAYEKAALAQRYVPGRLAVGTVNSPNDALRIIQAMACERGEKLVTTQHGGYYGTAATVRAQAVEFPYHGFATWGWTAQSGFAGNFVPLPAPLLQRTANRHRFRDHTAILVGTFMSLRRIPSYFLDGQDMWAYREDKLRFLTALAPAVAGALHYRPYHRAHQELDDETWLLRRLPQLSIHRGNLHEAALRCRLFILDHPGSSLNFSLSANVPTLCFWRRDMWPMCDEAREAFAALERVGILHYEPEAAAAHAAEVWPRVEEWWRSNEVQAARRQWCRAYARTSRVWPLDWLRGLWRLART